MELIESGILTPFEVTFIDPGLFVQAWIYDTTSGVPVGPVKVNMSEITPGTYVAYFTPVASKTYILVHRVFTDGTYTVLDANYPPASEAAQSVDFGAISLGLSGLSVSVSGVPANILNSILSNFLTAGSVGEALSKSAYRGACVIEGAIVNPIISATVGPSDQFNAEVVAPNLVAEIIEDPEIKC